jgi:hypothetical protein
LATYKGTVISGTDATDVFGLGDGLEGAAFTAHFKYNTLKGIRTTDAISDTISGGPFYGSPTTSVYFADLMINGVTDTFNVGQNSSENVVDNHDDFGRWPQTFFYNQFAHWDSFVGDDEFLQLFVLDAPHPLSLTTAYTGFNNPVLEPPIVTPEATKYRIDHGVVQQNYAIVFAPFSVNLQPIPEPSTWTLMIAGVGLAGAAMRRARRLRSA